MKDQFVLSVKNLKKVYPGKIPFVAVNEISFDLKEGEILGLLGPNGAGKTTTIQMLMSTLKPTSGAIVYFGKDFFKHRSEILQNVVFASTYVSLPWALTIRQNLEVFARLYGMPSSDFRKKIDPLMERFGIAHKQNAQVSQLSAGQITRLVLVKAFMVRPKIVLLDEPTASLDPDVADDVCRFVIEHRKEYGTSVLFTSHKMGEVSSICDRVLYLQDGSIIANDIPKNLARSAARSTVKLVISDGMKRTVGVAEELNLKYGIEHRNIELSLDEEQIAGLLTGLAKAGVHYTNIAIKQPTLEDYFLHMIKQKKLR